MITAAFVVASASIVRALVALTLAALLALVGRSFRSPPRRQPDACELEATLSPPREAAVLLLILAGALLMRTAGARAGATAPFWFAETEPLYVARMFRLGTFWAEWRRALGNLQVGWLHDSPLMLPVAGAFQRLLGPSFHLPLLIGASYGVAAVLLAWACGRALHSRSFGLLFAAFVAASPLQLVWSRLGGLYIASVPHVLLVIWVSWEAGRRRSVLLAIVAGLAAWASLYYYYAARVAIPLGLIALLAGARAARVHLGWVVALSALWALTFLAPYVALHPPTLGAAFWPRYTGYLGNKGERSLHDLAAQNLQPVAREARQALARYFLFDRTSYEPGSTWFRWDVRSGGLCLLPVALLGLLGLAATLRRPGRQWLWLAVAFLGFALPALSMTTARRFLVFDLAWCALAAGGLLALLRAPFARAIPARAVPWTAAAIPILIGGWSFVSVMALNAILPRGHRQPIPFGEAGFTDGLTCLRCVDAGREFQQEITRNTFVVLVDSDLGRENRTSPGGLPVYGKLGALVAGRPEHFLELYAVMRDFDGEPPLAGPCFDSAVTDFASYLIERIERAHPDSILWHFERPTQWELWFVGRLAAAGGEVVRFETPLGSGPGVQVRTPWARRKPAFDVIHALAKPLEGEDPSCPELRRIGATQHPFPVLAVAAPPDDDDASQPAAWVIASWGTARYRDTDLESRVTIGAAAEESRGLRTPRIHLLSGFHREYAIYDLAAGTKTTQPFPLPGEHGVDCAVRIRSHWWVVDPVAGTVFTTDPAGGFIPQGGWVGVARGERDEVVLAAADQWLVIYDLEARAEVRRFPAAVWPAGLLMAGECTPVLAGRRWYGTLSTLTSVLSVYDGDGRFLGHRRLDRFLALRNDHVSAIAATRGGFTVGVGHGNTLEVLELSFGPRCTNGPAAE